MFSNNLLMAAASAGAEFGVTQTSYTPVHVVAATPANPFTISGVDLGSDTGTKHIIIGLSLNNEPGPFSACTIAGEAATIVIEEGSGVYKQHQAGIAIAEVSGVTSGDIVITATSSNINGYSMSVFQMIAGSGTAYDTWGASLAAQPTGTLDIEEGGFGLSVAQANTCYSMTWAGMTERYDALRNPDFSHAWDFDMSAEVGRTITATPGNSPTQRVGIGASFGPAS